MSKKKKIPPSVPSKAYLVSFGDTMTALLAFFIVLNSLAKEQTGANLYSGTGSFVNAFSGSVMPGKLAGNRSNEMLQQNAQKPLYALAENMDDEGKIGPDDTNEQQRVLDRDKEQFQKFLENIEKNLNLKTNPELEGQVAFDSFEPPDIKTGRLSRHAIHLMSEATTRLRQPDVSVEIVLWATMPSAKSLSRNLKKSASLRDEVENAFWLKADQKTRIRYRVKPWLFADAKRPYLTVILGKISGSEKAATQNTNVTPD